MEVFVAHKYVEFVIGNIDGDIGMALLAKLSAASSQLVAMSWELWAVSEDTWGLIPGIMLLNGIILLVYFI